MNKFVVQKPGRPYGIIAWLLPILLVMIALSGCTFKVKLVGEDDEILDQSVTEIQEKTATFFSKIRTALPVEMSY